MCDLIEKFSVMCDWNPSPPPLPPSNKRRVSGKETVFRLLGTGGEFNFPPLQRGQNAVLQHLMMNWTEEKIPFGATFCCFWILGRAWRMTADNLRRSKFRIELKERYFFVSPEIARLPQRHFCFEVFPKKLSSITEARFSHFWRGSHRFKVSEKFLLPFFYYLRYGFVCCRWYKGTIPQ